MMDWIWAVAALLFAAVPGLLFLANVPLYRREKLSVGDADDGSFDADWPAVSILIPARNEEAGIEACVRAALASQDVDVEVIVLDDHSTDTTREILQRLSADDARLQWETAPELPAGWVGKQHACWHLARLATSRRLLFIDADVLLAPEGVARALAFQRASQAELVSGIPQQITGSFAERLLIPLIHFVLLGFLPLQRMRDSRHPSYGAGCGQFFLADREAYFEAGGHEAVRNSMHDGVKLPRVFRQAGFETDLFDATDCARCRMYTGTLPTLQGLAKNAVEGLASPRMILPVTALLLVGQVLPFVLVGLAIAGIVQPLPGVIAGVAAMLAYAPRIAGVIHYRQSPFGALLHPFGVVVLLAVQWWALLRWSIGSQPAWRGRSYPTTRHGESTAEPRAVGVVMSSETANEAVPETVTEHTAV